MSQVCSASAQSLFPRAPLAEEAEEVEAPAKPQATRFADILFAEADDEEGADEVHLLSPASSWAHWASCALSGLCR